MRGANSLPEGSLAGAPLPGLGWLPAESSKAERQEVDLAGCFHRCEQAVDHLGESRLRACCRQMV